MDCRTARLLLAFSRPGGSELRPAEAAELETHLHTCPECDALARSERRVDEHLGQTVRDVPLPVGLRQRIMDRLRKDRAASRRRWLVRAGSVAAAVGLVALSGLLWAALSVPALPVEQILNDAHEFQASRDSANVTRWFQEKYHVSAEAPREIGDVPLNYFYLADYGLESLQGKLVPRLLFVRGSNSARIYLVSDWQFRIKDIADGAQFPGSVTVTVWQHPSNPHLAYVVVGSLDPFLLPRPGAG
jgi:hypothetical protein